MLVEPLIGRHDDTAGFPVDTLHRLPFRPKNRVALAAEYDHMSAGTMLVSLLVSTDGEFRDMRAHGLLGEIELHIRAALVSLAVVRMADRVSVWYAVGVHKESDSDFYMYYN